MNRIRCGAGVGAFGMGPERLFETRLGGMLLPANAGALSAALLSAGVEQGASGVLSDVRGALVALPKIDARHYDYVPPAMRLVPVALVVSAEQLWVYDGIAQAAAERGTIRRAFLSRQDALAWLRQQARALSANQVWWSTRRSPL